MDSDNVNSINDTVESLQVANVVDETFCEIMSQADWPHLQKIMQLDSVSDADRPNFLRIPSDVEQIHKIKYETTDSGATATTFKNINYLSPEDFIDFVHARNTDDTNVIEVSTLEGITLFIKDNADPLYWTSFDDELIVFDAYDSVVDTTMQNSKSMAIVTKDPSWTLSDSFVPGDSEGMPNKFYPLLLAESKRVCHLYFKQQDSSIDAKRSLRGIARMRNESWRAHDPRKTKNFGRR